MYSATCNGKIVRKLGKFLEIETDHPFETLKVVKVQPMNCRHKGDVFKSGEVGDEVALNYVSHGSKGDWHATVTKSAPKSLANSNPHLNTEQKIKDGIALSTATSTAIEVAPITNVEAKV